MKPMIDRKQRESFDDYLARLAYEAHARWQDAEEYPEYESLPEAEKQRWRTAAVTVKSAIYELIF